MRRSIVLLGALLLLAPRAVLAADEKKVCLESYEKAQRLRADAKLRASTKELVTCSREVCPAMIKGDCGKWLEEVDQSLPSVVFAVMGPDGKEVSDVKISMDDEVLATEVTGTAVVVDPGNHSFKFERGGATVEERFVIREGEKRRKLEVSFAPKPAPPPAATPGTQPDPTRPPPETASPEGSRPVPALVWVLGGVGIAALGAFAGFAIKGMGDKSDLDRCKPSCPQEAIDDNKKTFVVGDVFLAGGLVALGAATILYLTRPTASRTARSGPGAPGKARPVQWQAFSGVAP